MRLSISSSRHRWLLVWSLALAATVIAAVAIERHWRALGYRPNVLDSMQLWSQQRDRVYPRDRTALVMLGASRIEFGIDTDLLQSLLPRYRPVMLAINARYPLAVLKDLADDPDFSGIVICDLESNAMHREYRDLQQPYVDYFHKLWTPNWRVHRSLLTHWQEEALIANPHFGAFAMLRYATYGGNPFRDYVQFHPDRSGDIDYRKTDPEAAKRHFEATVERNIAGLPKRSAQQWLDDIQPVFAWIRQIQSRGGQVIIYQSPIQGRQRTVMSRLYPDEQYWDRMAAASPAPVVDANRVEKLSAFTLPDDSHLDFRDKPAYTRALVETLIARGLVDNSPVDH